MTSSHHGPYDQGYTRATMAHTKRSDLARASGPHKVRRSPDWSLQLDSMKSESLVIGALQSSSNCSKIPHHFEISWR